MYIQKDEQENDPLQNTLFSKKVSQKCFVGGPPLEEMVVCGGNTAVGVHQWRKQRSGESAMGTQEEAESLG